MSKMILQSIEEGDREHVIMACLAIWQLVEKICFGIELSHDIYSFFYELIRTSKAWRTKLATETKTLNDDVTINHRTK